MCADERAAGQFYIGGYVMKADPVNNDGSVTSSGWGYLAMVCVYLYGVIYCASWQGITWLYASEIYPLHIRSVSALPTFVPLPSPRCAVHAQL